MFVFLKKINSGFGLQKTVVNNINAFLVSLAIHFVIFFFIALAIYLENNKRTEFKPYVFLPDKKEHFSISPQQFTSKFIKTLEQSKTKQKSIKKAKKNIAQKRKNSKTLSHKTKAVDNKILDSNGSKAIVNIVKEKMTTFPNKGIENSYGNTFFNLSAEEQVYIANEWEDIKFLNFIVTNRVASKYPTASIKAGDKNTIKFYLNPDGTISDLSFVEDTNNSDFMTIVSESILKAVESYKKPTTSTLMMIKIEVEPK